MTALQWFLVNNSATPQSQNDPSHPHPTGVNSPTPHRYKLIVRYDGHNFHGWQKQEPAARAPLRTVQGVLETAVRRTVRAPVQVLGASRTDAGVHAEGQVAAFTMPSVLRIPLERLHRAINSQLPDDLAVLSAANVPLEFNPIGDACSKAYCYTIHSDVIRPVFERAHVNHCRHQLDAIRMHQAARYLVGKHDFASFANTHHGRESTVRTVFSCAVNTDSIRPERTHIEIVGSGFLYHMVRIIAGTLVEVGRGHWAPEAIPQILAACDRRQAGPTLPPGGLCLKWVKYAR